MDFIFSVSSRDNTAFAGADYVKINNIEEAFIPGGPSVQTLTVDIVNDNNTEGAESFFLDISSSVSNVEIGDRASTTIHIKDEDSKLPTLPRFFQSSMTFGQTCTIMSESFSEIWKTRFMWSTTKNSLAKSINYIERSVSDL